MNRFVLTALGIILVSALLVSFYPRGIRNNNPGNIKRTGTQWQGQAPIQTDRTFVQFVHPKYGFRAMTRILRNYQRRGLMTLEQMIATYAPKSENDTRAYVDAVAKRLSINPNKAVELETQLPALLKAMAIQENGLIAGSIYSTSLIEAGIALA